MKKVGRQVLPDDLRLMPPNEPKNTTTNMYLPLARMMEQEHFSIALLYRSIYGPSNFRHKISTILNSNIGLLTQPILSSKHVGAITSLDIDNNNSDGRYMLSSSWDGTISLMDLEQSPVANKNQTTTTSSSSTNSVISPLHKSLRCPNPTTSTTNLPTGHSAAVTAVQWYTFDNGMFVSSSMDGSVLLWDTNSFQTAYIFRPFRSAESTTTTNNANHHVTCMTLPRSTSSLHSLIATGSSSSSSIVLCDVNSGAAVHTLQGHGRSVQCVSWSPTNSSFELCSGSADGTVRLWDIRKTGSHSCVCTLDYHSYSEPNTTIPLPPPPNAYAHLQSCPLSSHEDPSTCITNVAYSTHGRYLATVGTDRKLHIWKTSSTSSTTTKIRLPLHFLGEKFLEGPANRIGPTPLLWTISNNDSYIWIGKDNGTILRYKFVEDDGGGRPQWVFHGNLTSVQSLALRNVGGQDECTQIWSGSADGMILGWGRSNTTPTHIRRNNTTRNRYYFPYGTTTTSTFSSSPAALFHQKKQKECDEDCWSD